MNVNEEQEADNEIVREKCGLFIGMTAVPTYSNVDYDDDLFIEKVIKKSFSAFRAKLNEKYDVGSIVSDFLYQPSVYYAMGSFSMISLSYVDDFHFGNFSFRPYGRYVDKDYKDNSNFQYQVVNGFNLKSNRQLSNLDMSSYNFIGVIKLKINSTLLIGTGMRAIDYVKSALQSQIKIDCVITESFSWHEITCVLFCDSMMDMHQVLKDIRSIEADVDSEVFSNSLLSNLKQKEFEIDTCHLFTDTETIYGINPDLIHDPDNGISERYLRYINNTDDRVKDKNIRVSTKMHVKTGHEDDVIKLLSSKKLQEVINGNFQFVNGRRDVGVPFLNGTIQEYILFWRKVFKNRDILASLQSNVRKIHSNVSFGISYQKYEGGTDQLKSLSFLNHFFNYLKFDSAEIAAIESNIKSLHISRDICNQVITLFTNYNDIICDVNLWSYYLDLRALLKSIQDYLRSVANGDEKIVDANKGNTRKISYVTSYLLKLINIFEVSYSNRFLDSKRNGYNLDTKGHFNGGVHQILQSYDGVFKKFYQNLTLSSRGGIEFDEMLLPTVSYGVYTSGIKSTINVLHLNYFQLFQPEFFLFSLPKESINYLLEGAFFNYGTNDEVRANDLLHDIRKLKKNLAYKIHNEPIIEYKELMYKYLPVDRLDTKINYILYYIFLFKLQWQTNGQEDDDFLIGEEEYDWMGFTFWLWNIFIQTANLHNVDSSIRVSSLREHYFPYYLAIYKLLGTLPEKSELKEYICDPQLRYHLFDKQNCIHDEAQRLYRYLDRWDREEMNEKFDDVIESAMEMLRNFKQQSRDFEFVKDLTKFNRNTLTSIMNSIRQDDDSDYIQTHIRNPDTGVGVNNLKYRPAIFDPHGGLFVRDPLLRQNMLTTRLHIIHHLRDMSYSIKLDYILSLIKHADES